MVIVVRLGQVQLLVNSESMIRKFPILVDIMQITDVCIIIISERCVRRTNCHVGKIWRFCPLLGGTLGEAL